MVTPNLFSAISIHLQEASELYVAVALLKDFGLNFIETTIPEDCKRKYLVGIHLPTSPNALRSLLQFQTQKPMCIEAKIYDGGEVYHPKVYIIKKQSNEWVAFIGSSNATHGGLATNVEMNIFITDQQQCQQLTDWFKDIYVKGIFFDEDYIKKYEIAFIRNRNFSSTQKSNIDALTNRATPVAGGNIIVPAGQFLGQSDFGAYLPIYHLDSSNSAVALRGNVRQHFLDLDEIIYSRFAEFGIDDLHHPSNRRNFTSYHWHSRGYDHIPQETLWLNYGKSKQQLSKYSNQSFTNHIRLQIILRHTAKEAYIGIWLFLGKPGQSYDDRLSLKYKLNDQTFIDIMFEYLLELGGAYWINIGDDFELNISDLKNKQELKEFLLKDDFGGYFIIGRNYQPDDSDLSEENFPEVVLTEFSKLYKIYDIVRDKR